MPMDLDAFCDCPWRTNDINPCERDKKYELAENCLYGEYDMDECEYKKEFEGEK